MVDEVFAKTGTVLKVIELGLQQRVYDEMKKPKFSVEALTKKLKEEGIIITAQSVRKFIKKTRTAQQKLIQRDLHAAEQYKQLTMDYSDALKSILNEVEEVKNTAKSEKDYTTYNQLIGRLMQGIELIAKLSGDVDTKKIDINIIYNEINTDIEKQMRSVKRDLFGAKVIDIDAEIENDDKRIAEEIHDE